MTLLLSSISNAEIIRVELMVEAINYDNYVTGLLAGDSLGYLEYDDTELVRPQEGPPGENNRGVNTEFTSFYINLADTAYGLEDLQFSKVSYDSNNLYETPYLTFEIDTPDFYLGNIRISSDLYRLVGHDPANPVPTAFSLDYSATVVPIPAAVYLFASGLGFLGWSRKLIT